MLQDHFGTWQESKTEVGECLLEYSSSDFFMYHILSV